MTKPDQDGPDVAELLPLLAALPRPQLPEEVATRLDAAIARAVAERAGADATRTTGQPQRPSYAPRRPRLRNVAFGSAAACVVLVLVVVFAMSVGKSASTSGSSAGPASGQVSVLSSAPVTNPVLLSWAATALQNQSGPLHIGPAVRPGFSAAVTGIPTPDVGTSAGAASSGVNPNAISGAGAAVACLAADPVVQEALAPRQLLSAASGEYSGRSAILLVYSNGADDTTAYIVVVAVPCQGPGHTVLTSGVVPR
ncbi:MAG TPA: hypothetical protein VGX23_36565 [Actinocrinis sp.]|nr:hypothetical protein [Actinocrinis sp.]